MPENENPENDDHVELDDADMPPAEPVEPRKVEREAPVGIEPPQLELPTTPLAAGRLAFYEGELDDAIERFSEVVDSTQYDPESRAKALYWRAEARMQQEYTRASIGHFEAVARALPGHHLGAAASDRARELGAHFDTIDHPDPAIEDSEEA